MPTRKEISEIATAVDGEFTDIQLVENILNMRQMRAESSGKLKRFGERLAQRLTERCVTEETIGDHLVQIGPKMLTEYDKATLGGLRKCATGDQVFLTITQVPSGKQLKALSEIGGAPVKEVVAKAKRKIETDVIVVKIKKPRKARNIRRKG